MRIWLIGATSVASPRQSLHLMFLATQLSKRRRPIAPSKAHTLFFAPMAVTLSAFRITAANPPAITSVWSKTQSGVGSPFVTSTDGTNNVIVWAVGSGGDQRLHGYDGDTGNVILRRRRCE